MDRAARLEDLIRVVRAIPEGRVASYGTVGRCLKRPLSGLLAGRMMEQVGEACPWWRVLGADGTLRIAAKDPRLGIIQRERLEGEGIVWTEAGPDREAYLSVDELSALSSL